MYKNVLNYKDNIKELNTINEYKMLKPTMAFNRSIFCPNPIMIQDPQDAIIKEINKNRTSKDCRINLKAGKNIHIHLRLIKLPSQNTSKLRCHRITVRILDNQNIFPTL